MTNSSGDRLDRIDERLAQLISVGEQQQQNIGTLAPGVSGKEKQSEM